MGVRWYEEGSCSNINSFYEFTEQEKDIETQEIEQPVTLVKQMVTITEGSYRIGGNNVNFDTSNTQPFTTEFNIR